MYLSCNYLTWKDLKLYLNVEYLRLYRAFSDSMLSE